MRRLGTSFSVERRILTLALSGWRYRVLHRAFRTGEMISGETIALIIVADCEKLGIIRCLQCRHLLA